MSNQAVYDFDPDAYERYLAKQAVVARWVDQTKQHEPANPFTIIPSDASPPIQHPYSSHEQAAIGQWVDRPKQHEPANLFAAPFSGERERLDPKVPPQSPPQIQQVPYGYPYPYPYYPYPYQYQYPYQTMPHYPQGQLIPQYSTLPMSNIPPVIPQTLTPKGHLATKPIDNEIGIPNIIPREELEPKEAKFNRPRVSPIRLKEDKPASPLSPAQPPEDFTSKLELKPTFPVHIVRTPDGYRTERPRQTTEPGRTTSSIITSSSISIPRPSPSVPLHSTSDDSFPSSLVITRSTSSVVNSSSEDPAPLIAPFVRPHPLQNGLSSPAFIPPRSASSAISATPTGPMGLQRKEPKGQPVDLPSTSYEVGREDEPEYLTPNANQTAQLPPQNPGRGTAPWILASRKLHAPKKTIDVQFMARMADLRQQADGTNSTSSTPQARQSLALLGSPVSIASSAFSQSFSVASPPPAVEFPPTPVFTDQIPEGLVRKLESFSIAPTPKASLTKPHPVTATRSLATIHEGASSSTTPSNSNSTPKQQPNKLPASASSVRRGYWNRRGDHLTPDGYLVLPPPSMQYPDELNMYPFEHEGYRDHTGLYTACVRRPELPQSLSKHGKPPEHPYESFVVYV